MRVHRLVVAAALACACTHGSLIERGASRPGDTCAAFDRCGFVGGGDADDIVAVAVGAALLGVIGVALYRRLFGGP